MVGREEGGERASGVGKCRWADVCLYTSPHTHTHTHTHTHRERENTCKLGNIVSQLATRTAGGTAAAAAAYGRR